MVCPTCGKEVPAASGRCASCEEPTIGSPGTGAVTQSTTWAETVAPDGTPPLSAATTSFGRLGTDDSTRPPWSGDDAQHVRPGAPRSGVLDAGRPFGPRYHIITLLGVGGMAEVYRAWDSDLGLVIALKVIRPEVTADPISAAKLEKQFKNELRLARQVTHKHVVRIHDLGEINGIKYLTMPYVEGNDLAIILRKNGPLGVPQSLRLARQIAAGLEASHEVAVIHRDLKPANIMVDAEGHAVIMDFGVARSTSGAGVGATGGIAGTLSYMAPEQATDGVIDQRVDIYAFGLILYEMLVGLRRPSSSATALDDMYARFENGLPSVRTINPTIPETVAGLVAKCLEPDAAVRYQTSTELVAALNRLDDNGDLIPDLRQREPVPVLITDFENRSGDPVFEGAIEQTLTLAMEGASYISVFPMKYARADAAQLAPGTGDRITRDMGQLIARREGLKVLLSGAIDKTPRGFRLTLQATDPAADPATTKPISTVSLDVTDKAQVLPSIASMAARVREALGESKTEMGRLTASETFTASSLEAMRAYSTAQDLLDRARYPDAIRAYQQAIARDPKMGRAYAGMAVAYRNLKQDDEARKAYGEAIKLSDRMTDREKYRTLGGYYFTLTHNYEKAIENYETLMKLFPADNVALANLAFAHVMTGNFQSAALFGKQAVEADPRSLFKRYNYAAYAMYVGDFETSQAQGAIVLKEDPSFVDGLGLFPMAASSLALGDVDSAHEYYALMAAISDGARSRADAGEADLAMYLGRYRDALPLLQAGIALDDKRNDSAAASIKYVALAEVHLALEHIDPAAEAAKQAVALGRDEGVSFLAARVLLRLGQDTEAKAIAKTLAGKLQTQTAAYADLIRGEIALQHGDVFDAIERFRAAQKRRDSWFSRYLLGAAYAADGEDHLSEALPEFEACVKRRGETTDMFLLDTPMLRYLPPAYYWLARSQETVGLSGSAKANYEKFIELRSAADPPDPLVADARTRLDALNT